MLVCILLDKFVCHIGTYKFGIYVYVSQSWEIRSLIDLRSHAKIWQCWAGGLLKWKSTSNNKTIIIYSIVLLLLIFYSLKIIIKIWQLWELGSTKVDLSEIERDFTRLPEIQHRFHSSWNKIQENLAYMN